MLAGDEHDVVRQGRRTTASIGNGLAAAAGTVGITLVGVPRKVDVLGTVHRHHLGSAKRRVDRGRIHDLLRLPGPASAAKGLVRIREAADADAGGAVRVLEHSGFDEAAVEGIVCELAEA